MTGSSGAGSQGGGSPNLVTVAAAVATGLGTLGWVTFIGGAILWISFSRAGLPQAEAVAKVPTSVLIATGAEFVVAAFAAALLTIAALFLFEQRVLMALTKGAVTIALYAMPAGLLAITAVGAAWEVDLGYGPLPLTGFIVVCLLAGLAGVIGAILYRETLDVESGDSKFKRGTASFPVLGLVALITVPLVMAVATYYRAQDAPRVEPVALLRSNGTPFVGFFLAETSDRVFVGTFEERVPDPCEVVRRQRCPPQREGEPERIKVPARLLSLPTSDVRNLTVGPRIPLNANDALSDPGRPRTAREWAAGVALRLCEEASTARRATEARDVTGAGADETAESLPMTCSDEDVENMREFDEIERSVIEAISE